MSNQSVQNSITLKDTGVVKVQLIAHEITKENFIEDSDSNFSIENKTIYNESHNKSIFITEFTVDIKNPLIKPEDYDTENFVILELSVVFHAIFACDHEIDEDFLNSNFVNISAPAIAFPFLRAFISTLTLQAGYEAIILPSINFIKRHENKLRDQESSDNK